MDDRTCLLANATDVSTSANYGEANMTNINTVLTHTQIAKAQQLVLGLPSTIGLAGFDFDYIDDSCFDDTESTEPSMDRADIANEQLLMEQAAQDEQQERILSVLRQRCRYIMQRLGGTCSLVKDRTDVAVISNMKDPYKVRQVLQGTNWRYAMVRNNLFIHWQRQCTRVTTSWVRDILRINIDRGDANIVIKDYPDSLYICATRSAANREYCRQLIEILPAYAVRWDQKSSGITIWKR